jgi:hypothetical protein
MENNHCFLQKELLFLSYFFCFFLSVFYFLQMRYNEIGKQKQEKSDPPAPFRYNRSGMLRQGSYDPAKEERSVYV